MFVAVAKRNRKSAAERIPDRPTITLGSGFKVTWSRGRFVPSELAPLVMATVHPSSILRAPDDEARREETKRFTNDLRKVARALRS